MTTDAGRPVIVPRPFYDRPCLTVAEELVGKVLARALDGVVWRGRIVETEGYVGEEDQACHAARGPTPRNQVMYGPPGVSYVYFVYGMHHCFNAVCEREGFPAAVLIRALEPLTNGITATDGPAKLCRALAITRRESGLDLTRGEAIWIENSTPQRRA